MNETNPPDLIVVATVPEGHNGLPQQLNPGDRVYRFFGATYGCIAPCEVAVSLDGRYDYPFHGVPASAVDFAGVV